jgi:hypothetical protein
LADLAVPTSPPLCKWSAVQHDNGTLIPTSVTFLYVIGTPPTLHQNETSDLSFETRVEILQDNDTSLCDSSILEDTVTLTSSPDRNPFSSGTNAEDMPDSGDSSNSQESSSNVSFREFLIGDHNAHKFILLDIPLNILEAMYAAVSILPLMKYKVICCSLKQISFFKSFHLLFPEDNCLWSEFFSVLKNCFFKQHPHLDTNAINATVLVTDEPMVKPQQPHMDYCWETILLPSRRESRQNRCKFLKGSCQIPFTGHAPSSSDGS